MDHMEQFEELCNTTKANRVPEDFLMLVLLHGINIAEISSSINFTPNQIRLRCGTRSRHSNKIARESFFEAWDHFRGYLKDFPHTGYTPENLMHIVYQRIAKKYHIALNTARKGNFATNTVREANVLIGNLAVSNSNNLTRLR